MSDLYECPICGSKVSELSCEYHHIIPEVRVKICANCHRIITRLKMTLQSQISLNWASRPIQTEVKELIDYVFKLHKQIERLQQERNALEKGVYDVKIAEGPDQAMDLIRQGYEPIHENIFRRKKRSLREMTGGDS